MAAVICGVRHEMRRIYLFLPSSSSSTFSQCFLYPKSPFHTLSSSFYLCLHAKPSKSSPSTLSSSYPPSIHPHLLHSQTRYLASLSSHQSCLLTSASLSPCSFPSIFLYAAPFSTSPLVHKTRTKVEGGPPEGKKKRRPDKSELITLIDTEGGL